MSDELWSYWELDPVDLSPLELEYELRLRDVFNVTSTRVKTRLLRDYLAAEKKGELQGTTEWESPLDIESDINLWEHACDNVEDSLRKPEQTEATSRACWSRVVHLFARMNRMRPENPVHQEHVARMQPRILKIGEYLQRRFVEYDQPKLRPIRNQQSLQFPPVIEPRNTETVASEKSQSVNEEV